MKQEFPKEVLHDVYSEVNWKSFAERYFHKTSGWLYHKFDRVDVNRTGKPQDFSEEERARLQQGLFDLAERIRRAAEGLCSTPMISP